MRKATARATTSPEIQLLLENLDDAYERAAWHGPNLRGALRGVTPHQAAWRPAPGRHNIWELVIHAAYWKYAVWRRLTGEKRGSFPFKGSNWFVRPVSFTARAWRADLTLLEQQHRKLREAVKRLPAPRLHKTSSGSRHTIAKQTYGIAAHDLYHTGQIQLIKVLYRRPHAR